MSFVGLVKLESHILLLSLELKRFARPSHSTSIKPRIGPPFFPSKSPRRILDLLAASTGARLEPGRSLLFLDEVQAAPRVLSSLRYFHEEMPELHVIAAGSRLEFAMAELVYSVPVGRVEYMHLGPMTFEEALPACGQANLLEFLEAYRLGDEVPQALHGDLLRAARSFLLAGGMPESLQSLAKTGSVRKGEFFRQSILSGYREEFHKYAGRVPMAGFP